MKKNFQFCIPIHYQFCYCLVSNYKHPSLTPNKEVLSHLRRTHFEAAALDLLYGECSLALAHEMGVPAVGFWGSSPVSGQGANSIGTSHEFFGSHFDHKYHLYS